MLFSVSAVVKINKKLSDSWSCRPGRLTKHTSVQHSVAPKRWVSLCLSSNRGPILTALIELTEAARTLLLRLAFLPCSASEFLNALWTQKEEWTVGPSTCPPNFANSIFFLPEQHKEGFPILSYILEHWIEKMQFSFCWQFICTRQIPAMWCVVLIASFMTMICNRFVAIYFHCPHLTCCSCWALTEHRVLLTVIGGSSLAAGGAKPPTKGWAGPLQHKRKQKYAFLTVCIWFPCLGFWPIFRCYYQFSHS